jgi:hypothetical protein
MCRPHYGRGSPEALDRRPHFGAQWLAPARGSRGLDTKDEALIDDVVIVKIIVASRRDALIEALGIASDSPDSDRSQIHLVPGLPLFDKS